MWSKSKKGNGKTKKTSKHKKVLELSASVLTRKDPRSHHVCLYSKKKSKQTKSIDSSGQNRELSLQGKSPP